jgi:DNA invertase Pin-like site-specific DNA recombinase
MFSRKKACATFLLPTAPQLFEHLTTNQIQIKSNFFAIVREFESANITERLKNELIKTPF